MSIPSIKKLREKLEKESEELEKSIPTIVKYHAEAFDFTHMNTSLTDIVKGDISSAFHFGSEAGQYSIIHDLGKKIIGDRFREYVQEEKRPIKKDPSKRTAKRNKLRQK